MLVNFQILDIHINFYFFDIYFYLLNELFCHNNNLRELPDLPNTLTKLDCGYNNLTELPDLPNSLINL